jgi:hypothetical protein
MNRKDEDESKKLTLSPSARTSTRSDERAAEVMATVLA